MGLKSRFGFTDEDKQQGVSSLEDRPKCSASELKEAFDWLCTQVVMPRINDLLDFLDSDSLMGSTMVDYGGEKVELQEAVTRLRSRLETLKSTNGAANVGALNGETETTVQKVLDFILNKIENMEIGAIEIPTGGITTSKLADDCKAPFAGTADYVKGYGPICRYKLRWGIVSAKHSGYSLGCDSHSTVPFWSSDPTIHVNNGNVWMSYYGGKAMIENAGTYRIKVVLSVSAPDVLSDANNQTVMQTCSFIHTDAESSAVTTIMEDCKQLHYQYGCLFVLEKTGIVLKEGDKLSLSFSRRFEGAESTNEVSRGDGYVEYERLGD